MLEAPLEWQGLRLAPGRGGVLVTGLEGTDQRRFQRQLTVLKGYAALAADRRGERPPPPAAGGPAGAGRAGDPGRSLVRPGGGGGGPTRHPGGLLQRVRRPAGGLCRYGGEPGTLGWAAPGGEAAGLCPGGPREEGSLAEKAEPSRPCPTGRTGRRGSCCARCCGRCVRDLAGAGAPRDKGGAEWRSEPSSWNT